MRNISLVLSAFLVCACASHGSKDDIQYPKVKIDKSAPFDMRLKGKTGEVSLTDYHSDSAVTDYEQHQKIRDHEEILDFLVSTKVAETRENQLTIRTTTIEKDGSGSLHDFAFPEPDESIDFVYSIEGKVLRADPFPRESIFYLPPISLPPGDAKIGDTWSMDHAWVSSSDGLPLNLNMVTIFKDVVPCGPFGRCADLEVSGQVEVANPQLQKMIHFDSRIWGRLWFSLDKGDVVWSEVRSEDVFKSKQNEMHVLSCMVSVMRNPLKSPDIHEKANCEPSKKMVPAPKLRF